MKNRVILIILLNFCFISLGQINEVGISLGGTNYVGDIGKENYIGFDKISFGFVYKYNLNTRIVFRANYSYLPISGDDSKASSKFRNDRNISFSNTINELSVGIEYNFYKYDITSEYESWTPYLILEVAAFNYLGIKDSSDVDNIINERKTSYTVPFGIGIKSKLYKKFAIALETRFRYAFEDDLDYTLGTDSDWYMFTGISLTYTFGRPRCYKN